MRPKSIPGEVSMYFVTRASSSGVGGRVNVAKNSVSTRSGVDMNGFCIDGRNQMRLPAPLQPKRPGS